MEGEVVVCDLGPLRAVVLGPEGLGGLEKRVGAGDAEAADAGLVAADGDGDGAGEEGPAVLVLARADEALDVDGGDAEVAGVGEEAGRAVALERREREDDHRSDGGGGDDDGEDKYWCWRRRGGVGRERQIMQ